jgi:hypothetical protein
MEQRMKCWQFIVLTILAATSEAAEFRGIPATQISSASSGVPWVEVTAISGDGSTLAGTVRSDHIIFDCAGPDCGTEGFVLPLSGTSTRNLDQLDLGDGTYGWAKQVTALSFDGSRAMVNYGYRRYESALHSSGAPAALRDPSSTSEWLFAAGMTPDADVVVGSIGMTPFRWSQAGGFEGFAGVASERHYAPTAVSHDGLTTLLNAGLAGFDLGWGNPPRRALQWTAAQGPTELSPLAGFHSTYAHAVSADGSVIVGSSSDVSAFPVPSSQATIWLNGQPSSLPAIAQTSTAMDVSADGRMIVGTAGSDSGIILGPWIPNGAVLWKDGTARFLTELLATEYGLGDQLEGWRLTSATAISDDGTVIAGNGFAPDGSSAAWVVVLTVPEPASVVLAIVASIAVIGFRRKN